MRMMVMILAAVLALTVAGCSRGTNNPGPGTGPGGGGIAYVKIPFEAVEPGKEPAEVARVLEELRSKAGTRSMVLDGMTYGVITAGEKSSGGWSVLVESVGDSEGRVEIVYRIKAPAPGSINTAQITYPNAVVKFKNPASLPVQFKEAR